MAKKRISKQAKDKLARLKIDIVMALNEIRKNDDLKKSVLAVVRQMIEEEKDYVLSLNSGDDRLAVKHANAVGRIAGLTNLIYMIEGSGDEIERREEK